jgi:hypothetical protein
MDNTKNRGTIVFTLLSIAIAVVLGFCMECYLVAGTLSLAFGIMGLRHGRRNALDALCIALSIALLSVFLGERVRIYNDGHQDSGQKTGITKRP